MSDPVARNGMLALLSDVLVFMSRAELEEAIAASLAHAEADGARPGGAAPCGEVCGARASHGGADGGGPRGARRRRGVLRLQVHACSLVDNRKH